MCKAHSKVTQIKQQKYFHHLKGRGYNKNSVLYPGRLKWWKYFCCFICVTLLWALHIVIKQQFFYINNNSQENVYGAVIMAYSHCESSPGSFDECRMAPSGRRPKTKPDDLGCESACTGCKKLHPPSPFIITQPRGVYPPNTLEQLRSPLPLPSPLLSLPPSLPSPPLGSRPPYCG